MKDDNFKCFICGANDHKCDNKGIPVLLLEDEPYEVPDNEENRKKYSDRICGASVTCSICGRSAFQASYWM